MFLLVRLLTLSTFAAHAVLGCCLAHGSCLQEQMPSSIDGCCGHDHGRLTRCADGHVHATCEVGSCADEQTKKLHVPTVPTEGGQQHDCDDSRCAFVAGYDHAANPFSVSMDLAHVAYAGTVDPDTARRSVRCSAPQQVWQTLQNRAMLQVWII